MKTFFCAGLAALVAGLTINPAPADTGHSIRPGVFDYPDETVETGQLPPKERKAVETILRKRKDGYRGCGVHANACARQCGLTYREKVRQALCFKARRCLENLDACIAGIQDAYPVEGYRIETRR